MNATTLRAVRTTRKSARPVAATAPAARDTTMYATDHATIGGRRRRGAAGTGRRVRMVAVVMSRPHGPRRRRQAPREAPRERGDAEQTLAARPVEEPEHLHQ